ncbi:FAD-dependent oxidoreductase [Paractinoplanes brasiliensis]|uniref:Kynurenine 3-monooxygenase n=1 Tax=Paractinoplanes brasiliensis TaxID=52695 RepID=A0A4R6JC73_9ACTN|nr:NAD(P)/FAD-dependent oxidoreductase [Actinoplanes brasiliensis]TDO32917.1 kynurenine 3-monooxygenase [Actinoplanes brasiliensis]GID28633.1 kynurenine 3-monooxygenase [Actinoplanes brasiliensis]
MKHVAIVGSGLAGSLLACYLGRRGYRVDVYERRSDPRVAGAERGRSINLALSERGIDALRRIGLDEEVLRDALPMRGRMVHPLHGETNFQPYSVSGDRAINSIGRGALNDALLDAASATKGVTIHFDHPLTSLDPETGTLGFADGSQAKADVVLGADGAGSATRGLMMAYAGDSFTETVSFLDYGYKELTIPARDGEFALDPGALHIWPRGTSMMIALPNPDRSFTGTLFWPNSGAGSFASIGSPAAVERHFREQYPDLLELIPNLVDDYRHNPVGLLGTVKCAPWQILGRVALIGDAAHAIVPFYGQGANAAFEDVVELDRCLDATGDDWAEALPRYELGRRENSEAIAEMALANFVEMRDKVADPLFKLGKNVEHTLERLLPGKYVSRYELVSFSTTPYAEVRRRVKRQHQVAGAVAGTLVALAAAAIARRVVR